MGSALLMRDAFKNFALASTSSGPGNHQGPLGVRFIVKKFISFKLETAPMCHYDCIIPMCLPLKSSEHFTLFGVYSPNLLANTAVKTVFIHISADI